MVSLGRIQAEMQILETYYSQHLSPMPKTDQAITDESRANYTLTYRIGAPRRVHMIEGVSPLLGPVLYEVQVIL
jgi:hypothetical protein